MIKMTFLGCGNAFSYDNGQNNVLLQITDGLKIHHMAVDCGTDWRLMVENVMGWKGDFVNKMNSYIITHLHADHVGGLEGVALMNRFVPGAVKPELYAPSSVLKELWDKTLRGGLETLNYGQMTESEEEYGVSLNSYFHPVYLNDNAKIEIGETVLEPFTTIHVNDRLGQKPSCGLLITAPLSKNKILYTSDTQYCPEQLCSLYAKADVIFHDCETSPFPSKVHAHYNNLKSLPADIKEKMWLMHYNDGKLPNAKKDGFMGFVEQGQSFDFA